METVEVTFDLEHLKEIYKKYFVFSRKQEIKKAPRLLLLVISSIIILIGVLTQIGIWLYLGLIMLAIITIYGFYFYVKVEIIIRKFSHELESKAIKSESDFKFSFNSDIIIYEYESSNHKMKWNLINNYEENENDLYLYSSNKELFDIISESTIGKEKYAKFKNILIKKYQIPLRK